MSSNIAPTIGKGAKTVRKSKGKCKDSKVVTRSALTSPYAIEWPPLPSGVTPDILSEIQRTFQPLQCLLGKRKCKNRKQTKKREAEMESNPERRKEEQKRSALRSQLALGVNEVTRSLEKDQLQLVMVCRSAKPDLMTSHLPTLSATRGCPAIAVFHLSNTLSPLLNMKTVLAIGFRKPSNDEANQDFAGLVSYVSGKCPDINIPWMDLKNLPLEELAAELSKDIFSNQKTSTYDPAASSGDSNTVRKDSQMKTQVEEGAERTVGTGLGQKGESNIDNPAGMTKNTIGSTMKERNLLGNQVAEKPCQSENIFSDPRTLQAQASKKRKLSEIATSPGSNDSKSKRNKTAKMPYKPANVKHVKVISKASKGKKGKGKRGKKK
nr:ribonuclease P protein subunit p38-like [Lytechinus pictus]